MEKYTCDRNILAKFQEDPIEQDNVGVGEQITFSFCFPLVWIHFSIFLLPASLSALPFHLHLFLPPSLPSPSFCWSFAHGGERGGGGGLPVWLPSPLPAKERVILAVCICATLGTEALYMMQCDSSPLCTDKSLRFSFKNKY